MFANLHTVHNVFGLVKKSMHSCVKKKDMFKNEMDMEKNDSDTTNYQH